VIVATGSRPPVTGFQRACRWWSGCPATSADVVSIHDVLAETVEVGRAWSCSTTSAIGAGSGTALYLAERGHDVTIVTVGAGRGGGLYHSAADGPLAHARVSGRRPMRPGTVVLGGTAAARRAAP
jgi:hypothetical protein